MTSPAIRFSANLGFLWTDRPLPDAIEAAATAGFTAVEVHHPYEFSVERIDQVLRATDLDLISLNTGYGDIERGERGLAAVAGREREARRLIDQAVEVAGATGCAHVSVAAGCTDRSASAEAVFRDNLTYAATRAAAVGVGVLIEPLNRVLIPDYHLVEVAAAARTVAAIGAPNVAVMADTFHVMTEHGSLEPIAGHLERVGHVQISGWPDRSEPDHGIDFDEWLPSLVAQGYRGLFGAEYTPTNSVEAGLGWLTRWHPQRQP